MTNPAGFETRIRGLPTRGKRAVYIRNPHTVARVALGDPLDVYAVLLAHAARRFATWKELAAASTVSRTTIWRLASALRGGDLEGKGISLFEALRLARTVGLSLALLEEEREEEKL